jgi:UPF0716 protein FxsA
MPLLLLVLVFIVVPIAELYVIVQVGDLIGVLPTIALLLLDSIAGSLLLRSQGRAVWRRFNDTMRAGRIPHREAVDGALVIVGGALLLTPGFITDVVGLLLLLPPTRAVARRLLAAALRGGVVIAVGPARRQRRARAGATQGDRAQRPYDVEGTAVEADGPPPARSRLES